MEELFADLEWDVEAADVAWLQPGESYRITGTATALVTVVSGVLDVPHPIPGCAVTPQGNVVRPTKQVGAGGVLLSLGRGPVTIGSQGQTELRVVRLLPTPASTPRLEVVPDLVSVADLGASEPGAAALAPFVGRTEVSPAPSSVTSRLCRLMATTLVLAVLRAWAVAGCAPEGWPARTADEYLARALDAIHDEPGRPWTVEGLAATAAMSRSAFAERFRAETGASPLGYVTEVRMARARSLLADGALVSDAARRLGYASDEGFSRAFRRFHEGVSPSVWRAALSERTAVGVGQVD